MGFRREEGDDEKREERGKGGQVIRRKRGKRKDC